MEFENWVLLQWAFWLALIALVLAVGGLIWTMLLTRRVAETERRLMIAPSGS